MEYELRVEPRVDFAVLCCGEGSRKADRCLIVCGGKKMM